MGFNRKASNASFFKKAAPPDPELKQELMQAARQIQHWWKQVHLRQTAKEFSQYIAQVVSLHQATSKSLVELEIAILNKATLTMTKNLLKHLEDAKELVLPDRCRFPTPYRPERVFLSAYLIATKPVEVFDTCTDIEMHLYMQANAMLVSFEILSHFMGDIYIGKTPEEMMANDQRFLTEAKDFLQAFHLAQMAYFEAYSNWERYDCERIVRMLIDQYLKLESRRFDIYMDPDPRQIEFYESFGSQQDNLRGKIEAISGQEGLRMLEHDLQEVRVKFEQRKWLIASTEVILHQLALNPDFRLTQESCRIQPQKDVEAAIAALIQESSDREPILDVLAEICEHILMLMSNHVMHKTMLREKFSRETIIAQLDDIGLIAGLHQVINEMIEEIKYLESPGHVDESIAFQSKLTKKLHYGENTGLLLKDTVTFFYNKLSQIILEANNYHIDKASHHIARTIVAFEQNKFQERLDEKQFNLKSVLSWIDSIVKDPTSYRLDIARLCSQYVATYVTHAICIGLLQKPGYFDFYTLPETFCLDRDHLVEAHARYQRIFFASATLGYLPMFCQQFDLQLSTIEVLELKTTLLHALEPESMLDPKEAASIIVSILCVLLTKKEKRLQDKDEKMLAKLMEDICMGHNKVATLFHKRLGEQLSYYFLKGFLPDTASAKAGLYGLQKELGELGKDLLPLIRLHIKVHGTFYQHHVETQLWKPLFTILREAKLPDVLPALLSLEKEVISKTHAYIHKMAFLLSGLALIQQRIVFADKWDLNSGMKFSTMKILANSFGLVGMINDHSITKEHMSERLIEMMRQVAIDQDIPFEQEDQQKMEKMLLQAKNSQSPGCRAFLDELLSFYRQYIIKGEIPTFNSQQLVAEFKDEAINMCEQVRGLINTIKKAQQPEDVNPSAQEIPVMRTSCAS